MAKLSKCPMCMTPARTADGSFSAGLPITMREFLSREEASIMLGIGLSTFSRWRSQGLIPDPVRLGKGDDTQRFRRRELQSWVDAGCPPADRWKWAAQQVPDWMTAIEELMATRNRLLVQVNELNRQRDAIAKELREPDSSR